MKKVLFAATALSFAATIAYAQTDTAPPSPPQAATAGGPTATPPPPPPPPHRPGPEALRGPDGMGGPGMGGPGMHGPGRGGPEGWMKHHMMMMSKGARIRVSDGDVHVNVKCAEDDSTAECGQTVIRILKQMQADQAADEDRNGDDRQDGGQDQNNDSMNE